MKRAIAILAAGLGWGWGAPAEAETTAEAARYAACMERARSAPPEGLADADAWLAQTESVAARHCRATALTGLGRTEESAAALDALGRQLQEREPALAADLFRQAAMVQLEAGRLDPAEKLQDRGLQLAPDSVELLIDRALLLGARGDYPKALKSLERARTLAPARADILVLMASAHRLLGHADLAEEKLAAALALEPENAGALLERGIVRRLGDDKEGARADWERVQALAPDSPEAQTAAANLRLLDEPAPVGAEPE
jgi:tetratricopeptide (TPR) repeat protein